MKLLFALIFSLIYCANIYVNAQHTFYEKVHLEEYTSLSRQLIEDGKGNYYITGFVNHDFTYNYMMQRNKFGEKVWETVYDDQTNLKRLNDFMEILPNDQLVSGGRLLHINADAEGPYGTISDPLDSTKSFFIVIDKDGNEVLEWSGQKDFRLYNIEILKDGGFLLQALKTRFGDFNFRTKKFNADYQLEWVQLHDLFVGWETFYPMHIQKLPDNKGFIAVIEINNYRNPNSYKRYPLIFRIDVNGNMLWSKRYDDLSIDKEIRVSDFMHVHDNAFSLLLSEYGHTMFDFDGNIIRNFPLSAEQSNARMQIKDDGQIVLAYIKAPDEQWQPDNQLKLVGMTPNHQPLWESTITLEGSASIHDFIVTQDGGFALLGNYTGYGFLLKTDCFGNVDFWDERCDKTASLPDEVNFSPNPFSDQTRIRLPENIKSLKLYNVTGSLIRDYEYVEYPEFTLYRKHLPAGVYFYHITTEAETLSGKVVVQ